MSDTPAAKSAPDRGALVIALALLAIGALILLSTSRAGSVMGYSPVGPKTVPYILGTAFVALGLFTGVAAWRRDFPEREPQTWPPMLWVVGGLAAQLLLMKTVGFSIATGLLFAATAKGFGRGPLWFTVPIGVAFSFVVWFLFAKGLQLTLPVGPLERLF